MASPYTEFQLNRIDKNVGSQAWYSSKKTTVHIFFAPPAIYGLSYKDLSMVINWGDGIKTKINGKNHDKRNDVFIKRTGGKILSTSPMTISHIYPYQSGAYGTYRIRIYDGWNVPGLGKVFSLLPRVEDNDPDYFPEGVLLRPLYGGAPELLAWSGGSSISGNWYQYNADNFAQLTTRINKAQNFAIHGQGDFRSWKALTYIDPGVFSKPVTSLNPNSGVSYNAGGKINLDYTFNGVNMPTASWTKAAIAMNGASIKTKIGRCSSTFESSNIVNFRTNLPSVTDASRMFKNCRSFREDKTWTIFNGSTAITKVDYMFEDCQSFNQNITWNNSSIQSAVGMMKGCIRFNKEFELRTPTSLGDASSLFEDCTALNRNLRLNLTHATNISRMFFNCSNYNASKPWTILRNNNQQINISSVFENCTRFQGKTIHGWPSNNIIDASNAFINCTAFNQNGLLNLWSLNSATSTSGMFKNCVNFSPSKVGLLFSNNRVIKDTSSMFEGCLKFTSKDKKMRYWREAFWTVENTSRMFYRCTALSDDIFTNFWNLIAVTDASEMFYGCDNWNPTKDGKFLSRSTNMKNASSMFENCSKYEALQSPDWRFGKGVTDVSRIFANCPLVEECNFLAQIPQPNEKCDRTNWNLGTKIKTFLIDRDNSGVKKETCENVDPPYVPPDPADPIDDPKDIERCFGAMVLFARPTGSLDFPIRWGFGNGWRARGGNYMRFRRNVWPPVPVYIYDLEWYGNNTKWSHMNKTNFTKAAFAEVDPESFDEDFWKVTPTAEHGKPEGMISGGYTRFFIYMANFWSVKNGYYPRSQRYTLIWQKESQYYKLIDQACIDSASFAPSVRIEKEGPGSSILSSHPTPYNQPKNLSISGWNELKVWNLTFMKEDQTIHPTDSLKTTYSDSFFVQLIARADRNNTTSCGFGMYSETPFCGVRYITFRYHNSFPHTNMQFQFREAATGSWRTLTSERTSFWGNVYRGTRRNRIKEVAKSWESVKWDGFRVISYRGKSYRKMGNSFYSLKLWDAQGEYIDITKLGACKL